MCWDWPLHACVHVYVGVCVCVCVIPCMFKHFGEYFLMYCGFYKSRFNNGTPHGIPAEKVKHKSMKTLIYLMWI